MSDAAHRVMVGRDVTALGNPHLRSHEYMAAADRAVGEVGLAYNRDRMWRDEGSSGKFKAGMRVPPTADFATGDPRRVYHHDWRVGDALLWDNRRLMHRATPWDYTQRRIMWHSRIAGDPVSEAALAA